MCMWWWRSHSFVVRLSTKGSGLLLTRDPTRPFRLSSTHWHTILNSTMSRIIKTSKDEAEPSIKLIPITPAHSNRYTKNARWDFQLVRNVSASNWPVYRAHPKSRNIPARIFTSASPPEYVLGVPQWHWSNHSQSIGHHNTSHSNGRNISNLRDNYTSTTRSQEFWPKLASTMSKFASVSLWWYRQYNRFCWNSIRSYPRSPNFSFNITRTMIVGVTISWITLHRLSFGWTVSRVTKLIFQIRFQKRNFVRGFFFQTSLFIWLITWFRLCLEGTLLEPRRVLPDAQKRREGSSGTGT